jgi:two-component system response regulator AtoC
MAKEVLETTCFEGVVAARLNGEHFCAAAVSPAMRSLHRVLAGIAPTDIPVLLVGESGTGKQVVAAEIHRISHQQREPFIHISCGALTLAALNDWLHSLNGGNASGAVGAGITGTVFLDEISELNAACQSRLLQALPTGNGMPGGLGLGLRVVSATSRDLEEEMHAQRFREELYYRINGACLRLPPLRHRKEDVPLLIDHFLERYAAVFQRPRPVLTPRTSQILGEHSWPGNVRELENVVKKIVALGDEEVAIADLNHRRPELSANPEIEEGVSLKQAARKASHQAERELILKTLGKTRWNRKRAAQELRISYKALLYKLKQIGVEDSTAS